MTHDDDNLAVRYAEALAEYAAARDELARAQAHVDEVHARLERIERQVHETVTRNRPLRVARVDDHRVVVVRRDEQTGAIRVDVVRVE